MSSIFQKIKNAWHLYKHIDLTQLSQLASKVDLPAVMSQVGKMSDQELAGLMKMLQSGSVPKVLPPVEGDFYHLSQTLSPAERVLQLKVRSFMETEVKPIVNGHWMAGTFPHDLIPKLASLNICGVTYSGYGCPGLPFLMEGILAMEMARVDTSISTFFGVQSGLVMGSIYLKGSEEQKNEWLPALQQFKKIGAFGLTEPEVGSGAAGGLNTTANWQRHVCRCICDLG
jgi:glutaryl-CoA dehydrogenase